MNVWRGLKIAIADDNQSILEALRSVIDEEDDMRIVGTADNGARYRENDS